MKKKLKTTFFLLPASKEGKVDGREKEKLSEGRRKRREVGELLKGELRGGGGEKIGG